MTDQAKKVTYNILIPYRKFGGGFKFASGGEHQSTTDPRDEQFLAECGRLLRKHGTVQIRAEQCYPHLAFLTVTRSGKYPNIGMRATWETFPEDYIEPNQTREMRSPGRRETVEQCLGRHLPKLPRLAQQLRSRREKRLAKMLPKAAQLLRYEALIPNPYNSHECIDPELWIPADPRRYHRRPSDSGGLVMAMATQLWLHGRCGMRVYDVSEALGLRDGANVKTDYQIWRFESWEPCRRHEFRIGTMEDYPNNDLSGYIDGDMQWALEGKGSRVMKNAWLNFVRDWNPRTAMHRRYEPMDAKQDKLYRSQIKAARVRPKSAAHGLRNETVKAIQMNLLTLQYEAEQRLAEDLADGTMATPRKTRRT